jgi:uncharacterized protein
MTARSLEEWETLFKNKILEETRLNPDPAHDFSHFERVVSTARRLAQEEGAEIWVVLPAAWLHDLVNVPKNDPRRSEASRLSANEALRFLEKIGYPSEYFPGIRHAIEAHSFSAAIRAETLEAKIVQDADRLDGLGAIGIARCFSVGGALQRKFYHPRFWNLDRVTNDQEFTVDHFFIKLFKIAETLQTRAGQAEGAKRAAFMKTFIDRLSQECGVHHLEK